MTSTTPKAAYLTTVPATKDLLPWAVRAASRASSASCTPTARLLKQLSRDECLTLMASVPVGRVIYTRRALPAVDLVNFALDQR